MLGGGNGSGLAHIFRQPLLQHFFEPAQSLSVLQEFSVDIFGQLRITTDPPYGQNPSEIIFKNHHFWKVEGFQIGVKLILSLGPPFTLFIDFSNVT